MSQAVVEERLFEAGETHAGAEARERPAGEDKSFRAYDPNQILLLAPSLQDWVPEGHLARFVCDLVDEALDLSAIYACYEEERGFAPYDLRLMVKLLIYGYATGNALLAQARGAHLHGCRGALAVCRPAPRLPLDRALSPPPPRRAGRAVCAGAQALP